MNAFIPCQVCAKFSTNGNEKHTGHFFFFLSLPSFLFLSLSDGIGYMCRRMIGVRIVFITKFCDLMLEDGFEKARLETVRLLVVPTRTGKDWN